MSRTCSVSVVVLGLLWVLCPVSFCQETPLDYGQAVVENGYAKKLILPKTAAVESTTPAAAENTIAPAPVAEGGYVASKSGKIFHESTCSHASRDRNR